MILSAMLEASESDVICDFAETYGIYDYTALPLQTVATLAAGLRGNSRIKMRLAGARLTTEEYLTSIAVDYLALLWWAKTKDGQKGTNKPKSVREAFIGAADAHQKKDNDVIAFDTPEEFLAARDRILRG